MNGKGQWAFNIIVTVLMALASFTFLDMRSTSKELALDVSAMKTDIAVMKNDFQALVKRDIPTRAETDAILQKMRSELMSEVQKQCLAIKTDMDLIDREMDRRIVEQVEREKRLKRIEDKIEAHFANGGK